MPQAANIPHKQRQMAMSEALPCCHATVLLLLAWLARVLFLQIDFFNIYCTFFACFSCFDRQLLYEQLLRLAFLFVPRINCTYFTKLSWYSDHILNCNVFTKLSWLILLVSFNHLDGWKTHDEFGTITKSCWRNNKSQTTNNMASAPLVGDSVLYVQPADKRFANRWAYKHCQPTLTLHKPIFRGDRLLFTAAQAILNDCIQKMKRLHRCSPLYKTNAIRQRKSYAKYGLTCIYIDSCSDFAYLLYICKIWRTTTLPPGVIPRPRGKRGCKICNSLHM